MISEPVVQLVKAVTWWKKWEEHPQTLRQEMEGYQMEGYQNLCPHLAFPSTQHSLRETWFCRTLTLGWFQMAELITCVLCRCLPCKDLLRLGQPENQEKLFKALSYTYTGNMKDLEPILMSLIKGCLIASRFSMHWLVIHANTQKGVCHLAGFSDVRKQSKQEIGTE